MINQERLALGTAALRSGDYPQATGCLRGPEGYCCLGVLTEVAIANGLKLHTRENDAGVWSYGVDAEDRFHESGVLLNQVRDWYGFDHTNPVITFGGETHSAVTANDSARKDFNWIADAFDATYGETTDEH